MYILTEPTGPCCDRCIQQSANDRPQTPTRTAQTDSEPSQLHSASLESSPSKTINQNGKRRMGPRSETPKVRRDEHLKKAWAVLEKWRFNTKRAHYTPSSFTASALLPDTTLTALASNGTIRTLTDLKDALKTPWIFADRHGEEVIQLLRKVDEERLQEMEAKKKRPKAAVPLESSSTFNTATPLNRPVSSKVVIVTTLTNFSPLQLPYSMDPMLILPTHFSATPSSNFVPTFIHATFAYQPATDPAHTISYPIPATRLPSQCAPTTIPPFIFYGPPPSRPPPRRCWILLLLRMSLFSMIGWRVGWGIIPDLVSRSFEISLTYPSSNQCGVTQCNDTLRGDVSWLVLSRWWNSTRNAAMTVNIWLPKFLNICNLLRNSMFFSPCVCLKSFLNMCR